MEFWFVLLVLTNIGSLLCSTDKDCDRIYTSTLIAFSLIFTIIILVMYAATMWPIGTAFSAEL